MFSVRNDEKSIFPMIEILIKKNHLQYSLNSVRIDSTMRIFNGVSSGILLNLIKSIGNNIVEDSSKTEYDTCTSSMQSMLCFVGKDIVAVKYRYLPEIILARYFFKYDDDFVIICNSCYRSLRRGRLNTFDMVFHLQSQDLGRNNREESSCKIILISKGSGEIALGSSVKMHYQILPNYGMFYIIYSSFIYLMHIIMTIKRYLKIVFSGDLDIEKLFIEHFLSKLDTKIHKYTKFCVK